MMKKTELMITTRNMKKTVLKQTTLFILFIIIFVFAKSFASNYLLSIDIVDYNIHLSTKIIFNLILISVSFLMIKKLDLFKIGGLSKEKLQKPLLLVFPLVYLVILNLFFAGDIPDFSIINLLILTVYCVSIGFAEELSIRSVLLPLFLKLNLDSKRKQLKAVLFSSLFFGLLHLIHFNKGIPGEISQVFFATFIGFMFGALLLTTKKVYPLIIIHALVDFVGKLDSVGKPIKETVYDPMDIESAIFSALLVLPCLIYGIFILKNHLKKDGHKT